MDRSAEDRERARAERAARRAGTVAPAVQELPPDEAPLPPLPDDPPVDAEHPAARAIAHTAMRRENTFFVTREPSR